MQTLHLKGRSAKGKRLISFHGDVWEIVEDVEKAQCFDNTPAFRIIAQKNRSHTRWIRKEQDKDFTILR